tara:strand:+ start:2754 stop:3137 length:384 start_codon:yes stop_codon:yes gene_type:complete
MGVIMKEIIEAKVRIRSWTFNEISNLMVTIESLSNEIYSEMNLIQRFDMVKETKINDSMVGYYYADVLREMCLTHIKAEVAGTIRNMLDKATVNFGGINNEVSERSMGGKPHKERTTNEKKDSSDEE